MDAANAPVACETFMPGYHGGDTYGQTPVLEFHHYLCAVPGLSTLQGWQTVETAAQQSIAYFAAKEEA